MKKILALVLFASVLMVTQAVSFVGACHKEATITYEQWPNGIIEVNEEVQWLITIVVGNGYIPGSGPGVVFHDVVVTDKLGAELEIDLPFPVLITQGTVGYYTTGKSEKVHLTWYVGDIGYMEFPTLMFYVSTDINPGGKHEYTTPGEYCLNSGPTMKYFIDGVQYSQELNSIMITVEGFDD